MAVGGDEEVVIIMKPLTDNREYRRVRLSNSLQALLISDPDTDKCAASMNVNVGSFCDPDGLEGLANFLEHMFYASEKYPTEDSYFKYITELQKHLSSPNHRYHRFSTGSWETLEVRPRANGKFYDEYYSANVMCLLVYGKDSLGKIQGLVDSKFQFIRNTNRNSLSFPGQPCTSEHLQIVVKSVPIKEGHKLRIVWPITPSIRYYKEEPCMYLGHLIGHEAEGSLFYVLKKLG